MKGEFISLFGTHLKWIKSFYNTYSLILLFILCYFFIFHRWLITFLIKNSNSSRP